jgi:hypothetical protein
MIFVESIAVAVGIIVVASLAVWGLYTLVKITGMAKEERSNEAPYKVEPPKSTEQMAVSLIHKPIEWTFANAPEKQELRNIQFDPVQPPKRKYTKRSGFWTAKRKKAAARKAKKKTSKSK